MVEKTGKIIIKTDEGKEIECDCLFTFDSEDTKKSYIVYTDNTKDDLGNVKVYANTYNKNKTEDKLGPIKTEEEWALIEQIFSSVIENKGEKNE